jgi:rubrerythrin
MNKQEIIDMLIELAQLDFDATRAYEQAMENIDVPSIHKQIAGFRDDHIRHIADLSAEIDRLGGKPPEISADIKGFILEGFTTIRSLTGTEGALKAMRGNELLTNSSYSSAFSADLPPDVKKVVERNYDDEKRHLRYIEDAIEKRLWEPKAAKA